MQENYNYYAFISYSHRDRSVASWLQKSLEHSRIPSGMHRIDDSVPRKITPIFRDDTDLVSHGSLSDALTGELEASRYLIVICSPASAGSEWVDREVRAFISRGRADRIIPVVVSGEINSGNPETECLPPALRELGREEELLCISLREHGKRGTCQRVLASLLQVRLDQIVRRDRKQRRKRVLAASALAAAALAAAAFLVWYNVPFVSLFRDYTYQWDRPVGIGRVSASEQAARPVTYRFTTRRNRVEKIERINGAGTVTEAECAWIWTESAEIRFRYADEGLFGGQVIGKDYFNAGGQKLYSLQYSREDGTGRRAADLVMPGEAVSAFSDVGDTTNPASLLELAASDPISLYDLVTDRTVISRYLQTYDADGRMILQMYMKDNWNHPATDNEGVGGLGYSYDAEGRITQIDYLNSDGTPFSTLEGCAREVYEYDGNGLLVRETRLKADGTPILVSASHVSQEHTYDGSGRILQTVNLDDAGNPMSSAEIALSAGTRVERDTRGNILRVIFLDEHLQPADNDYGYAETVRSYDEKGRCISERYTDVNGNPAPDSEGIFAYAFSYDPEGNISSIRFMDENGNPAWMRQPNCSGFEMEYTGEGLVRRIHYLNPDEAPTDDLQVVYYLGCAVRENQYNQAGQLELIRYLNENLEPVQAFGGAWQIRFVYQDAALARMICEDAEGNPVLNRAGLAITETTRKNGVVTARRYLDPEGRPIAPLDNTYAGYVYEYDEADRLTALRHQDEAGRPVMTNEGYADIEFRWDLPYAEFKHFLDADGNEMTPDAGEAARKSRKVSLCRIYLVAEDSPGARIGLRPGDIIIGYNGWNYAELYITPYPMADALIEEFSSARETEKRITVVRHGGNGWESLTVDAPAGMIGFAWRTEDVSVGFLEKYLLPLTL